MKKIICMIITAAIAFSMVGCNSNKTEKVKERKKETEPAAATTKIETESVIEEPEHEYLRTPSTGPAVSGNKEYIQYDYSNFCLQYPEYSFVPNYTIEVKELNINSNTDPAFSEFMSQFMNKRRKEYTDLFEKFIKAPSDNCCYFIHSDIDVYRADYSVFSFALVNLINTPELIDYISHPVNIDPKTCRVLEINDVTNDFDELCNRAYEELSYMDLWVYEMPDNLDENTLYEFLITREGIYLVIDFDVITGNEDPVESFKPWVYLSYSDNLDILVQDYWNDLPKDYFLKTEFKMSDDTYSGGGDLYNYFYYYAFYDIDGDNIQEYIKIENNYIPEKDIFEFYLDIDGTTSFLTESVYLKDPYLIFTDGKVLLQAGEYGEHSYAYVDKDTTKNYIIIDNKAKYLEDSDFSYPFEPADPDHFICSKIVNVFYDRRGFCDCKIDDRGMIVSLEDYYHFLDYSFPLETICDLNAYYPSSGDNKTGNIVIPTGSRLFLVGSDAETFIDVMNSEGEILRLDYVSGDTEFVDGKPLNDCFTAESIHCPYEELISTSDL
ncbi:MAG: hypothetical protein K6F83_04165 [Clostridiales bacterium]|nr:hypothetical protein [Clostridiales bacterium]